MELCIRGIRTWVWMDKLKLKLNDDKTELMIIGSRQQLEKVSVAELSVGDTSVASASTTRLLVWSKSDVWCSNYKNVLYRLLLSAHYKKDLEILNVGFNQMFASYTVMGRVDCNSFLYSLPRDTNINKLQRPQNMAARLINNKYSAVLSDHTCTVSVTLVTNKFQD